MEVIQTVRLAVYDLSNGMAAHMSQAILGQRIEGIWHTGVYVYGREYFFGGGIQQLPIGEFARGHGLQPVRVVDIGETQISEDIFHDYLHSISSRFSAATYDLINNNCNNFSNECTQFLTGCGIPSYIIDLPKIVFATPAGAMLRPMIENMQQGVRGGNGPMDPFGSSYHPPAPAATGLSTVGPAAMAESSAEEKADSCGREECGKHKCPALIDCATYAPSAVILSEPILSQNKDNGLLSKVIEKFRNIKHSDGSGRPIMSAEELALFTRCVESIQAKPVDGSIAFPQDMYSLIMKLISENPSTQCALFYVVQLMMIYETNIGSCYLLKLVQGVAHMLDPNARLPYEMSRPAHFLAVCSLSNYFSRVPRHASCPTMLVPMLDVILDVCGLYISKDYAGQAERPELRQFTASLLHNILLFQKGAGGWSRVSAEGDVHPHVVQLLCSVVEDIADEQDIVVLHRRLSVAYNILSLFPATKILFKDLGFVDTYFDLKARRSSSLSVLASAVDQTVLLVA